MSGQAAHREGYAHLLEAYRTCGLLVLDDLGSERVTEWVAEQFFLILDYRARHRMPVFLTSDYRPEELLTRLEERVMERLRECATGLEVKGPICATARCSIATSSGSSRAKQSSQGISEDRMIPI